jgi:ADP-heptose:LPS heptosyltransferase
VRLEHVLVARLDSLGDVLLTGPAIRAVAAHAGRVTMLCGPRGQAAARLLPGVDEVLVHEAAWIDPEPAPLDAAATGRLVEELRALRLDAAVVFTSFHQSPLPLALLLRLAGVPRIAGTSVDYPGSLLDVRHRPGPGRHEVEHQLDLAAAAGYPLPAGDDGALRVLPPPPAPPWIAARAPYVAVHPGASAPARAWSAGRHRRLVELLTASGRRVLVTGSAAESELTRAVAGPPGGGATDLGGRLELDRLAAVLAGAEALVAGNTGPAHLAAAVGTPVVSLFAPTVPAARWRPWRVPHVLLGDQDAPCAGSRAIACPIPGHPCLEGVAPEAALAAVESLAPVRRPVEAGR